MSDRIIRNLCSIREKIPAVSTTGDMPESAVAALAWAYARDKCVVLVCDGPQTLETLTQDAETIAPMPRNLPLVFPPWESLPTEKLDNGAEISGQRLNVLRELLSFNGHKQKFLLLTSIQGLMQKTPPPQALSKAIITLEPGRIYNPHELAGTLVAIGYSSSHEVTEPGSFALRGGILDVWSPNEAVPLRIEFFGDEIESLRAFDPAGQRSTGQRQKALLLPASEWRWLEHLHDNTGLLIDYLPAATQFIWYQAGSIEDHAALFTKRVNDANAAKLAISFSLLKKHFDRSFNNGSLFIAAEKETAHKMVELDLRPGRTVARGSENCLEPDALAAARREMFSALKEQAAAGTSVSVFFDTTGSLQHYMDIFGKDIPTTLQLRQGILSGGFESPAANLIVVAENDLLGRPKRSGRPTSHASAHWRSNAGERLQSAEQIEPGDLVVHVEHGIGRYQGVFEIEFAGRKQEVLTIEYDEGARLHVPASQAHVLSRYIGASAANVRLHRLGGKRWNRERQAAEQAVADLASTLLQTQAEREARRGHAFAPDSHWQHEFEAAFPFRETPDQIRAGIEIKKDMENRKPMDRLICGDAGYGKTEMAMRAAFKCCMDGRQTAMLVPTTVLAQQHFDTFRERMAAYPVRIEMLSRFRSGAQRNAILKGLAEGTVDIIIGTHGLINKAVHFKNLGLVVIDEEQRFGVEHKERFKQLRRMVDVLTLTATPIPRTLYMSLSGARNLSLMQTPPVERQSVETIVARTSDKLIREAIMREINREGQVFFLHNRVMTIDWMLERLVTLVPEARFGMAHGQMPSRRLADIMHNFVNGAFDVLLSTTIIESGMDIPRANTILIDRADRFGVADLYQLRGRVGRSHHKGYAYMLLPAQGRVESDARRRIQALARHSGAGAGFSLALRDLEIRGSGNLLGAAQSGHIAAVGFNLYCRMLKRTVAKLKNEPVPEITDTQLDLDFVSLEPRGSDACTAAIPYNYIDDETVRVTIYRRLSEATLVTTEMNAIDEIEQELSDRFGPLPQPVQRLLASARLRISAAAKGIIRIKTRDNIVYLTGKHGQPLMKNNRHPRLEAHTPDKKLTELLKLIDSISSQQA